MGFYQDQIVPLLINLTMRDTAAIGSEVSPAPPPLGVVERLNREINAGLADPMIKTRLADMGGMAAVGLASRLWQAHRRRDRQMG